MDNDLIKFDPLLFKCPKGVVVKGTEVEYFVSAESNTNLKTIYFMCKEDEDDDYTYSEMEKCKNGYKIKIKYEKNGHYWYNFQLKYDDNVQYLSKTYDSYSYITNEKGKDFFQSVLEKEYTCVHSMQGGVIYQIYVDRFCKKGEVKTREPLIYRKDWGGKIQKNTTDPLVINREVFGGNFQGIISKLSHLKELGVTTIYLNPISMANSNHKYDTADYMTVDPMFGTEKDFKELIEKAKEKGIGIIFDGVYNHTGSDSIYFNKYGRFDTLGAYKSKNSKFYKWYDFDEYPDKYSCWWGIDTLPSINDSSEDFQNYISGENGVLDKFLKMGVQGVRLDVVDEITDKFVKKISERVHKYGDDKVVMGEVWEDASTKISYSKRRKYFAENELNSVMNYPIKETILKFVKTGDCRDLISTLRMLENNYPKVVLDNLMNFLGTHDTQRIFSELISSTNGDREKAQKLLKIATTLSFTLPGVPSVFYGNEYGMENNDGSSRGCFDWENYNNDIFKWYVKLGKLRKLKVFENGKLSILYSGNGKLVFDRTGEKERVVVCINLSDSPLQVNLQGDFEPFVLKENNKSFKLDKDQVEILIEKK